MHFIGMLALRLPFASGLTWDYRAVAADRRVIQRLRAMAGQSGPLACVAAGVLVR